MRSVAASGVARSCVVPTANVCSVRSPSMSAVAAAVAPAAAVAAAVAAAAAARAAATATVLARRDVLPPRRGEDNPRAKISRARKTEIRERHGERRRDVCRHASPCGTATPMIHESQRGCHLLSSGCAPLLASGPSCAAPPPHCRRRRRRRRRRHRRRGRRRLAELRPACGSPRAAARAWASPRRRWAAPPQRGGAGRS